MKHVMAIALSAGLAACAQTPPGKGPVSPATADAVAKCQYLDDVSSTSGRYGLLASAALDDTRTEVLAKASQLGATHLVWDAPIMGQGSTTSRGKAYRCAG